MKKLTKKRIKEFEEILSYEFNDKDLLINSLTHKSFANEIKNSTEVDNEKLEFLGDAVLNLLISKMLMEYFPELNEGLLSKKRSSLVNEKALAKISKKINIGEYLRLGKGEELTGGREKDSILANALEALIGAVYLDGEIDSALEFIKRFFRSTVRYSGKPQSYKDYKTLCQEYAQKIFKKTPQYKVVKVQGPEHKKVFESEIFIDGKSYGKGKGRSKKDSEQKGARSAIKKLESLL